MINNAFFPLITHQTGTFICCTIEDHTRRPSAHDVCQSLKAILPEFHISKVDGSIIKTEAVTTEQTPDDKDIKTKVEASDVSLQTKQDVDSVIEKPVSVAVKRRDKVVPKSQQKQHQQQLDHRTKGPISAGTRYKKTVRIAAEQEKEEKEDTKENFST